MNPIVVHFYFPIFGTLFIPIDNPISRIRRRIRLGLTTCPLRRKTAVMRSIP